MPYFACLAVFVCDCCSLDIWTIFKQVQLLSWFDWQNLEHYVGTAADIKTRLDSQDPLQAKVLPRRCAWKIWNRAELSSTISWGIRWLGKVWRGLKLSGLSRLSRLSRLNAARNHARRGFPCWTDVMSVEDWKDGRSRPAPFSMGWRVGRCCRHFWNDD